MLFKILLFFVPLVLFPTTSELFEFNKMIATYALATLIVSAWLGKMILTRKIIFRRTILDFPLLIFLLSQFLSTITSIDFRTSLLGYYSRFNGGFASSLSYALLYWAWVSNMDAKKTLSAIRFLVISACLVSLYAILQHFGIDKDIWVQDVQQRVFSTLGQPNWLAAWIAALIPLAWNLQISKSTNLQIKSKIFWLWFGLSTLFFLILLYTKSRSGILGFAAAEIVFWLSTFVALLKEKSKLKFFVQTFIICHLSFVILALATGTPWTPSISKLLTHKESAPQTVVGPALEVGGTESGKIRKIVWRGALEIWRHYPILGTGVETFAYSYYNFRPIEHNLVSEWDFLYNKAHNEYLNLMATTGTLGIVSYLVLVVFSIYLFLKNKSGWDKAFLAGYISILVTNFFGFTVTPVALQFFLYPAMAITFANGQQVTANVQPKKLTNGQKAGMAILLLIGGWLLVTITRYWYADVLYAKGRALNHNDDFVKARSILIKTVSLSPREAIFWDELAQSTTDIAVALEEAGEQDKAFQFSDAAIKESQNATYLSPKNVNLKRNRATLFIKLSPLDETYLTKAKEQIFEAITLAPTDAKLFFNLGLTELRLGEVDNALRTFEKAIAMKPNYKDARLAYGITLSEQGEDKKAIEEFNYILTRIDPNDALTKQLLDESTKK